MLIIKNKGKIDPLCFELIGASTKREDSSKIGFFGSGLKYALAVLLRHNIEVKIFSGIEYKITTKEEKIGKNNFERILINGKDTSYTVSMGPDWELWFALREIYSNAIDEGGAALYLADNAPSRYKTNTYFCIEETKEIKDFYSNIEKFFIVDRKPVQTVKYDKGTIDLYEKLSDSDHARVYRKGILINSPQENNRKSIYDYNFSEIVINENRTAKYYYEVLVGVAEGFSKCQNAEKIKATFSNVDFRDYIECSDWWSCVNGFSDSWKEALDGKMLYPKELKKTAESVVNGVWLPERLYSSLKKFFKDSAFIAKNNYIEREPRKELKEKVEAAKKELESFGFSFDDMKIVYGHGFASSVVACADILSRVICFNDEIDIKQDYAETLLEEWVHIKYAVSDESLDMQNVLFRLLVKAHRKNKE